MFLSTGGGDGLMVGGDMNLVSLPFILSNGCLLAQVLLFLLVNLTGTVHRSLGRRQRNHLC